MGELWEKCFCNAKFDAKFLIKYKHILKNTAVENRGEKVDFLNSQWIEK